MTGRVRVGRPMRNPPERCSERRLSARSRAPFVASGLGLVLWRQRRLAREVAGARAQRQRRYANECEDGRAGRAKVVLKIQRVTHTQRAQRGHGGSLRQGKVFVRTAVVLREEGGAARRVLTADLPHVRADPFLRRGGRQLRAQSAAWTSCRPVELRVRACVMHARMRARERACLPQLQEVDLECDVNQSVDGSGCALVSATPAGRPVRGCAARHALVRISMGRTETHGSTVNVRS
jgi:hypothetical protein